MRIGLRASLLATGVPTLLAITAVACGAARGTTHTAHSTGRRVAGASYLLAISCPPKGACIAVGKPPAPNNHRKVLGKPPAHSHREAAVFLTVSNGKPGAVHSVAGTEGLYHVACPNANFCIALGRSDVTGSHGAPKQVYLDISHGQAGPLHTLDGMSEVSSIGCGSDNSCWVPGAQCTSATACTPKVAHIVNGTLKKVYTETGSYSFSDGPADTEDADRGPTPACFSATSCTLAGASNVNDLGNSSGLILSLNNGTVKITHRVNAVSLIRGLDCTAKNYCTLVGDNPSSSVNSEALTLASGKLGALSSLNASVGPLACRSASACFAFGSERSEHVIVPIDHGEPGVPERLPSENVHPDIYAATCTTKLCVGGGTVGQYPKPVEGWILSF
jgi:hypothetical protein